MVTILDGKTIAQEIHKEIKLKVDSLPQRKPGLAAILVGDHPPSHAYVKMKHKGCEAVGIHSLIKHLPASISEIQLLKEIEELNADETIDGILVQLPLPAHISPSLVTHVISPRKDVDGLHPLNVGKLLLGESGGFIPCTPQGIKVLLERSHIPIDGRHVVILGRSNLVGKPLAALLMQKNPHCNATVTVAHSHTLHLQEICLSADILVVAVGSPLFVTADFVNKECVVIDVGIHRQGTEMIGDVDFHKVKEKCSAITPVPGGVGPMTIAMLLQNTLLSFLNRS